MRVREIPVGELQSLENAPWVDLGRHCMVAGDYALVPVKSGFSFDREVPERKPYRGRGFYMVGTTAVVRGKRPSDTELEELIGWRRPRCVVWVRSIRGVMRLPDILVLAGTPGDVCHRENGITYYLDPAKVMFAQGNRLEKQRMADTARLRPGERVADMCAGIGYFTIPVAVAGAVVHATEINPVAFGYLERNVRANRVDDRVTAECGDCRALLHGEYDRVILGHFSSSTMVASVLDHVHRSTVLHVHSTGPVPADLNETIASAGLSADVKTRIVKKFSPGKWHFVQDIVIQ